MEEEDYCILPIKTQLKLLARFNERTGLELPAIYRTSTCGQKDTKRLQSSKNGGVRLIYIEYGMLTNTAVVNELCFVMIQTYTIK